MRPAAVFGCLLVSASSFAQATSYSADFDHLFSAIEQRYAYAERVDWDELRALREVALEATSDAEALDVFERALEALRDPHAHLGTNGPRSPRLIPSHIDVWLEWEADAGSITAVRRGSAAARAGVSLGDRVLEIGGRSVIELLKARLGAPLEAHSAETLGWALRIEFAGRRDRPRSLGVRRGKTNQLFELGVDWAPVFEGPLAVERIGDDLAHITLHDSLGSSETIAAFDRALDQVLAARGLILDLRETPGGGNSTVARALLGRFVDERQPYQRHAAPEEERATGIARSWLEEVSPRGHRFPGRVVVLVGRWTGSMGEGLALGFDALGAEVIGDRMAGLLGALTEIRLPHTGWLARFAHERLSHVDGTPRERWRPPIAAVDPTIGDAVDEVLEVGLERLRAQ